jgi:Alcohol dehydrogenase GroES-like domain
MTRATGVLASLAMTAAVLPLRAKPTAWTPPESGCYVNAPICLEEFMKAIVISQHGGPEVLHYTDFPEPSIGANDVLVRVRACALNHLDLWVRRGIPGMQIPLPHIPGSDIAGEIVEVGAGFPAASCRFPTSLAATFPVKWRKSGRTSKMSASARRCCWPLALPVGSARSASRGETISARITSFSVPPFTAATPSLSNRPR